MTIEDVYIIGVHPDIFRGKEPRRIIGMKMVTPEGLWTRLCYHVRFEDGKEDYIPVIELENGNIAIVTLKQLIGK